MQNKIPISKTRRIYFIRLIARALIFATVIAMYIANKSQFDIANGWDFFEEFSPLHLLWGIWMLDMLQQLIPLKAHISIGSQKVFKAFFIPADKQLNRQNLEKHTKSSTSSAYMVMVIWLAVSCLISILHLSGLTDTGMMVIIATFFYVCDLICVLIWCPFRLIMKNKCCTTCRIFNWDHMMMFVPIITVNSFFSWSLVTFSLITWLIWELTVQMHPERFCEKSNKALRCSECTDKLCTQYCRKNKKSL